MGTVRLPRLPHGERPASMSAPTCCMWHASGLCCLHLCSDMHISAWQVNAAGKQDELDFEVVLPLPRQSPEAARKMPISLPPAPRQSAGAARPRVDVLALRQSC